MLLNRILYSSIRVTVCDGCRQSIAQAPTLRCLQHTIKAKPCFRCFSSFAHNLHVQWAKAVLLTHLSELTATVHRSLCMNFLSPPVKLAGRIVQATTQDEEWEGNTRVMQLRCAPHTHQLPPAFANVLLRQTLVHNLTASPSSVLLPHTFPISLSLPPPLPSLRSIHDVAAEGSGLGRQERSGHGGAEVLGG